MTKNSSTWSKCKIMSNITQQPAPEIVSVALPNERHHGWRYIGFGPDDKLYVGMGAPCNVCERDSEGFAQIWRMNPDGSGVETFARGVRNTVGFTWHPETGEFWFTDNGRDWMGDDLPPCELNHAPRPGMDFGFPHCHGGDVPDPDFDDGNSDTPGEVWIGVLLDLNERLDKVLPPAEDRIKRLISGDGKKRSKVDKGLRVRMIDVEGTLRDLSAHVADIAGATLSDAQVA